MVLDIKKMFFYYTRIYNMFFYNFEDIKRANKLHEIVYSPSH